MTQDRQDSRLFVVGIGASAGGLQAIEDFFKNIPIDSGGAFVVVQHLSPDFKSLMKELLERCTQMTVHRIEDGMPLEANHVYLMRPRQNLVVRDCHLYLTAQPETRSQPNFPINIFFESLAAEYGECAIGIVLSGTGSDGSSGLQAVNDGGGLVLVQAPASAEFTGMPESAIATGIVDLVLPPPELAELVYEHIKKGGQGLNLQLYSNQMLSNLDNQRLQTVINILEESQKVDFSYCKVSTLARRTFRRCSLTGCANIDEYIDFLKTSPQEQDLLKDDLLIGVTRFFRDKEAWNYLGKKVIPDALQKLSRQDNPTFRVWTAACATGEETYSMAILIDRVMQDLSYTFPVKIFATDIDTVALNKAAEGIYPSEISANIPQPLLSQYFHWRNNKFHVKRRLREMIIFAPHNLTRNAGFTQMNLITCRNVLIYMRPKVQQQILRTLHFSLKTNGILFLGGSESPGDIEHEFFSLNKKWKIFQKRRDVRLPLVDFTSDSVFNASLPSYKTTKPQKSTSQNSQIDPILHQALINIYKAREATCVLLDNQDCILHTVIDAIHLLQVPQGNPTHKIASYLPSELRVPVSTALNRARRDRKTIIYTDIKVSLQTNQLHRINVSAIYNEASSKSESFLTLVLEASQKQTEDKPVVYPVDRHANERIIELENELQQTRENLQATVEELETTNEEQQATNEELLASNEELQSTNEELHSVNEELYTVNTEYQSKIAELTELTADINNLLTSTEIGVIFLDRELRVRKFTKASIVAINLVESDIERPLTHITHNLDCNNLFDIFDTVLTTEKAIEKEVRLTNTQNYFLMRVNPYRNESNYIDGIVISFVPIDELKQVQWQLAETLNLLETIYETAPVGLALYDQDLRFVRINPILAAINGLSVEDHIGQYPQDIVPEIFEQVEPIFQKVLKTQKSIVNLEVSGTTPANPDKVRHWITSYYPVQNGVGVAVTEVTEFKEIQQSLASNEARLSYLLKSSPAVIFSCSATDNYRCLSMSENVRHVLGYEAQEFIDNADFWVEHLHPEDREKVIQNLINADPQDIYTHEYRLRCKDGSYRWFEAQLKSMRDSQGEIEEYIGYLIDIDERKIAQEALRNSESLLFRLTLEQSNIMVFIQNNHLVYNWVYNPISGYSEADFLNKVNAEIFPLEQAKRLTTAAQTVLETRSRQEIPLKLPDSESDRYFKIKLEPIKGIDNEIKGIAGVAHEITLEKRQALKLAETTRKAQAASQAKGEFLANMSHEIRTPMNAILGFSDLLKQNFKNKPENVEKYLDIIIKNGRSLMSLLDDILDLSKIEAGQLQISYEPIAVQQIIDDLEDIFRPNLIEKTVDLVLEVTDKVPRIIIFDEIRLRQILINVVGNAIKFTHEGHVKLTISGRDFDAQTHTFTLLIAVEDTGIGISSEQKNAIFQSFRQSEGQSTRRYGGTGLGLTITKRLTEMLNGTIDLMSEPKVGTTFTLTFTEVKTSKQNFRYLNPDQDLNQFEPLTLLFVDDILSNRQLMESLFEDTHHTLLMVESGHEALECVRDRRPDAIFLDLKMPGLDGEQVANILKADPTTQDIPIIIVTASITLNTQKLLQVAQAIIQKPLQPGQIVQELKKLFAQT
ncbi:MAG: chemotaxis protein CheB [Jaaginema sp. PMC 1079.18]|nr:chemotaxis protein CheB [Jaaginema sp. PMC 1080.18]MEC4850235.1 chemotaxis protein CheB [Jaaginema sp. PMC 1079.18]MEC4867301.1 chemotaxis protein CheB [Jaaginema sp. PMC 1078.18]